MLKEVLKASARGKRAFVLGTGPSLNRMRGLAGLLADEVTIGVNTIYQPGPTPQDFRGITPTVLCICDAGVYHKCKAEFDAQPCVRVYGFRDKAQQTQPVPPVPADGINIPRRKGRGYYITDVAPLVFDLDPLLDGFSVALDAVQVAFYMGCDPVYLLGCDCTTDGHYYDPRKRLPEPDTIWAMDLVRASLGVSQYVYRRNGRHLLNAGVGGTLDCVPRIGFDCALRCPGGCCNG